MVLQCSHVPVESVLYCTILDSDDFDNMEVTGMTRQDTIAIAATHDTGLHHHLISDDNPLMCQNMFSPTENMWFSSSRPMNVVGRIMGVNNFYLKGISTKGNQF